jgi:hypothetical protein
VEEDGRWEKWAQGLLPLGAWIFGAEVKVEVEVEMVGRLWRSEVWLTSVSHTCSRDRIAIARYR